MMIKARIGNWRIHFSMAYVYDVIGINSLLPDNKHMLMWDFDTATETQVINALKIIQMVHDLPNIYIMNTGKPNRHIAYCFVRMTIQQVAAILADTPNICWGFLKWGIIRNKWTLRVTPKCNRKIHLICVLTSPKPETSSPQELQNWVQYETLHDNFRHSFLDRRIRINALRKRNM